MKTLTPAMRNALIGTVGQVHSDPNIYAHARTIGALEARGLARPRGNAGMYVLTDAGHTLGVQLADAVIAANAPKCGCEHTAHFDDQFGGQTGHDYQAVPAGDQSHPNVGPICDPCAATCLAGYDTAPVSPVTPHGWESTATPVRTIMCAHCGQPATQERINTADQWIKLCDSHMCLRKEWEAEDVDQVPPVAMPADHTIPMVEADARQASYGITHQSRYVYLTSKSSYPTRIEVWDNTNRLNARNGQPVRWGEIGPIDGGDGAFLDPNNKATDAPVSILLSPECITIDAYGTGTGTAGSGQIYAADNECLRPGETVSLAYPDSGETTGAVRFTGNGHGYVEII